MRQDELVLLAVKLVFGGLVAFLAIFLWSKLYDGAWMAPVSGNRPSPLSPSFFGPPETYYQN